MNDMSGVIVPKSDQINADDLIAGPRTIRIADVKISPGTEQPVSIVINGDAKVFRPCKSMSRVLVACWGADAKAYVGRSLTLYRDPNVKWGGLAVGGIRISHMSDMEAAKTLALTETRASRKPFTVKPLAAQSEPKPDKVTDGVRALIQRIDNAGAVKILDGIKAEPATVKQRAWLVENRPQLAAEVDAAIARATDRLGGDDDPFGANDGALSEDNPTATEGPSDADRGEDFVED